MATRNRNLAIPRESRNIIRYRLLQAITPCLAQRIVRRSWWVVDGSHLLFLDADTGHVPQESVDEMVINQFKRRIFPWADIRQIPEVYLVKHGREGWQVPYGRE